MAPTHAQITIKQQGKTLADGIIHLQSADETFLKTMLFNIESTINNQMPEYRCHVSIVGTQYVEREHGKILGIHQSGRQRQSEEPKEPIKDLEWKHD